ncbi:MAG: type II secretion system protein GspG [Deltaproteobacteria bacterium CG_4_10_14_0_2_um_filter_43_8]|nr:MAG: type II secretion system protein GspG [Deltaproteobacteria bacterium CG11_big_fil_rev_8_21_14_0_20_42_23]PJA21537.1 MAG: type II secretion system protein GspG [Deltaproteobacteria bacterium CG_4_10_14_0_2_um_filter_43_8]PJC63982.1 MAG: type II secretion system protein GspG [Deltaproteobacteria bacterium CG_4_9_14_0_2_um_filter_42_21]
MKKYFQNVRGMTLIEIMVVITILGLIATVVTVNVLERLDEAKIDTAKTQMKAFEDTLDQFRRDAGFYPATEQGLQALVEKPSVGRVPKRYPSKGYMKSLPKDPWNCDYVYYSPGIQGHDYEIYSLGADCVEGGEEVDADISSFETDS